jgi:hypothetical protein
MSSYWLLPFDPHPPWLFPALRAAGAAPPPPPPPTPRWAFPKRLRSPCRTKGALSGMRSEATFFSSFRLFRSSHNDTNGGSRTDVSARGDPRASRSKICLGNDSEDHDDHQ